ncbi:MAG TPA: phage holin family protein [Longimicrobiaceae bacterium]|nr:phage holin family protein [Longimicrobiaceae bacterium]
MSRILSTAVYAVDSLKKVAGTGAPGDLTAAASVATVASLLSVALGARNVGFLIVTLVVMTLDMVTGIARAYLDPNEVYSPACLWGGLVGKLLRLSLVLVAALLDWTMVLVFPVSADTITQLMPITKGAFVWLIVAEASSVIQNVRHSQGDAVIPAVLIRAIDRLRMDGREPPRRRHYDRIVAEAEREGSVEPPGGAR